MTINNLAEIAKAEREIVKDQQFKEKVINEEFKIWKKTVPLLYDTIHTHTLDHPSLSVKWLPTYEWSEDKKNIIVKFLYGTNSSQHTQDYLKLGSIELPGTLSSDFSKVNPNLSKLPIPSDDQSTTNFKTLGTWEHNGEVNSLEISPNKQNVITFDNEGIVHLYKLTGDNKESIDFKYHKLEGYSLEWLNDNEFLSGSSDSQIALWDVSKPSTPIQSFKSHNAVINDLSLNRQHKSIFGSTSDDYTVKIHDLRSPANDSVAIDMKVNHIQNAVKFHPQISTLVATGGRDNVINLYDLRNPSEPFRKLFGHNDTIMGLRWDQYQNPNKISSWSLDNRVIIWDLNHLDEEFVYPTEQPENSKKKNNSRTADPCLTFISGGHTNKINEIDIHPAIDSLHITCGDDNLIEIWKPKTLYEEEEEEEENDDSNDGKKDDMAVDEK